MLILVFSSVFVDNDDILSSEETIEDEVFYYETYKDIFNKMRENLSDKEQKVLEYYLDGYNYVDIAKLLDTNPKSIDNTLTRIKNKLKNMRGIL